MDRTEIVTNNYTAKIESNAVFATAATSHRSRIGYMPPVTPRQYGLVIEQLGRMAQSGDRMAFLVSQIIPKINLYGDRAQICVSVYDAMFSVFSSEFFDVVRYTGPETGRPSSHRHAWTLANKITALGWANVILAGLTDSTSGHGWALVALAEREGVWLPQV